MRSACCGNPVLPNLVLPNPPPTESDNPRIITLEKKSFCHQAYRNDEFSWLVSRK